MKSTPSPLSPLLQVRFKHHPSSNVKRQSNMEIICPVKMSGGVETLSSAEFDTSCSGKTFDADLSYRSQTQGRAIADRHVNIKSCMKVHTQRDSLSRIATRSKITASELEPVQEQKSVRFNTVEFREYPRILSDNPSTSSGPPIGIGWRYDPDDTISLDLDSYEEDREGTRRTKRELAIPPAVREDMLRVAGHSRSEITQAVRIARKHKDHRISSVQLMKFDPILERVDTVKHGVKKIIPRRRSSDLVQ